jgi:NDP-sugar pyrophosphorylase family protein
MFGTNYKGVPIFYVKQDFDSKVRDKPWRTVDALCYAKKVIDCPFVVCNGDVDIAKKTILSQLA